MASSEVRRGVHRTMITLGMAFLLIGVVLLTVSNQVVILGICFLSAGTLAVLCYILVTVSSCVKTSARSEDEENQTRAETQTVGHPSETDATQFAAPRYEDVVLYGTATVWAVTLGPPPDIDPPPYHNILAQRRGANGDLRLPNPTLLRISSDIHELKAAGLLPKEGWKEPLTPPPTYDDTLTPWELDFQPSPEESTSVEDPDISRNNDSSSRS